MRKQQKKILITFGIVLLCGFGLFYYRIKTAKKVIQLKDVLEIEIYEKRKVSSFIDYINGVLIDDFTIQSKKLGKKKITFSYRNEDHMKLTSSFELEVVDRTPPIIWVEESMRVPLGTKENIKDMILCGDNYDSHPRCELHGEYDLTTVGKYPLVYRAVDSSGNQTEKNFSLQVYQPVVGEVEKKTPVITSFDSILAQYKNKNTKVGLDISRWQEVVDFEKIKKAGAEFVMLRFGGTDGFHGAYYLDSKFHRNIEEAKKHQIPVGLYFHSYAHSISAARKEARWLLSKIKNYDIKFPIAFDWEDWTGFNQYHISFYQLTEIAKAFMQEITNAGYDTMLYSSKNYLEKIWLETPYDVWLAHYTKNTDYQKEYKMWQLCSNGTIDGISTVVDIDILFRDKK